MTREELAIRACKYAVATVVEKGSHAFGTKETGKFETIEWYEVLEWLNEVEEHA